MIQFKRRNTIWLAALSVLMALVMISGNVTADVQALIFGLFVLALAGTFVDLTALTARIQMIQQQSPLSRARMSPQAREAAARAQSRHVYRSTDVQLVDVGLIASQSGREGMAMRRTRTISKDDDGVRPFLTLQVPPQEAERNARIRYEITDQNGREQYIYEMSVFLRDGEMNILADNHLPLRKNDNIAGMGDWDLRVYVNSDLVAVHNFALTASSEERRRRLGAEYYVTETEQQERDERPARPLHIADDDEEIPLSLEDLLRSSSTNNRS